MVFNTDNQFLPLGAWTTSHLAMCAEMHSLYHTQGDYGTSRCRVLLNSLGSKKKGHILHVWRAIQNLGRSCVNLHQEGSLCKCSVRQFSTSSHPDHYSSARWNHVGENLAAHPQFCSSASAFVPPEVAVYLMERVVDPQALWLHFYNILAQ